MLRNLFTGMWPPVTEGSVWMFFQVLPTLFHIQCWSFKSAREAVGWEEYMVVRESKVKLGAWAWAGSRWTQWTHAVSISMSWNQWAGSCCQFSLLPTLIKWVLCRRSCTHCGAECCWPRSQRSCNRVREKVEQFQTHLLPLPATRASA